MSTSQRADVKPRLGPGDHAPVFSCPDTDGELFDFYVAVTGKPIALVFCGDRNLKDLATTKLAEALNEDRVQVATFCSGDAAKIAEQIREADWPFRTMVDEDGDITSGFAKFSGVPVPSVFVLDPNQRIVGIANIDESGDALSGWLDEQLLNAAYSGEPQAVKRTVPVLTVPRVLEPEDCEWLIGLWREGERQTGKVSYGAEASNRAGVAENIKRREDYIVNDPEIEQRILGRVMPRLVPELKKVLHFHRWDMEALRVGCYKATDSGFFNVHRDNCNPSVAKRRYAVTINLNTGEYEGGNLRFPEYGNELFCPPAGGAIVFSCSMLHEVLPVTAGERFTLLTFLKQPG